MNTKRLTLMSLFLVWSLILTLPMSTSKAADLYWDDGITHVINDNTYNMYHIHLDYTVPNDPGTHIDLLSNGDVEQISAWNNSSITLYGGSVGGLGVYHSAVATMYDGWVTGFGVNDFSTATISGGSVGNLGPWDNSVLEINGGVVGVVEGWDNATVTMTSGDVFNFWMRDNVSATLSGGSIKNDLSATYNAVVTMAGGSVGEALNAGTNGIIYLEGIGFKVTDLDGNTSSLVYNDKLSDYGTLVYSSNTDYYTGTITGTLSDGSDLDNIFRIYNNGAADIIVIPEPSTLSLFAMGCLFLGRKKR